MHQYITFSGGSASPVEVGPLDSARFEWDPAEERCNVYVNGGETPAVVGDCASGWTVVDASQLPTSAPLQDTTWPIILGQAK